MAVTRIDWHDLPVEVRRAVETHTGPVRAARTVSTGRNSALAVVLDTSGEPVFVKGLHSDHPGVVTQTREAVISPYVESVSPRLRWHTRTGGWDLLGFDVLTGRHADYRPGSDDLPAVVALVERLGAITCPDLPEVKNPAQRWRDHVEPSELDLLDGSTLLHTDYNPHNVIVDPAGRAHLVDWAWPTRGAAFIDPATLVFRLIADGHTPATAEAIVSRTSAWAAAPPDVVDAFARANASLWDQITRNEPDSTWKRETAAAARYWSNDRRARPRT